MGSFVFPHRGVVHSGCMDITPGETAAMRAWTDGAVGSDSLDNMPQLYAEMSMSSGPALQSLADIEGPE